MNIKSTSFKVILIIIILLLATFIYKYNFGTSKINYGLEKEYPMLKDKVYLNYFKEENSGLDKIVNSTQGRITYLNDETGVKFYCNNLEIELKEYAHYSAGWKYYGGWSYTKVIDCENFYIIYYDEDSKQHSFFGPFYY